MARFEIKSKNGKWLASAETIQRACETVQFYERNEPVYKPCIIKDTETGEYIKFKGVRL